MELNPRLVEQLGPGFAPSGAFLNHLMIHAVGCYGITLQGVGDSHALAAEQAADGTFHLFDVNDGHFQAPDAQAFRRIVDWYFAMTGYDTRFKRGALIVGVEL